MEAWAIACCPSRQDRLHPSLWESVCTGQTGSALASDKLPAANAPPATVIAGGAACWSAAPATTNKNNWSHQGFRVYLLTLLAQDSFKHQSCTTHTCTMGWVQHPVHMIVCDWHWPQVDWLRTQSHSFPLLCTAQ
jgi:hypothetical protein